MFLGLLQAGTAHAEGVGDLFVEASMPGARILVDGEDTGQVTPAMLKALGAGPHVITVDDACARTGTTVDVQPDVITRTELVLPTGPGALEIGGTPTGATVLLDGVEVGQLPWASAAVPCGESILTVRAADHLAASRPVQIHAGETEQIEIQLQPTAFGRLVIDVNPVDALVTVDGAPVGTGPRTIDRLVPGFHAVAATKPAWLPLAEEVLVEADAIARLTLNLTPKPRPLPAARIVLDSAVSALAIGAGAGALLTNAAADRHEAEAATFTSESVSQTIRDVEVAPRRAQTVALAVTSGLAAAGATVLWVTTDFTGTVLGVRARF